MLCLLVIENFMEDLINQLYNFVGEFGKPSSPIFVYFTKGNFYKRFKLQYLDNDYLNSIIILQIVD